MKIVEITYSLNIAKAGNLDRRILILPNLSAYVWKIYIGVVRLADHRFS